ncbi:FMN-dependent NADH-azoreductase [Sphingosinicella microcystinivorans]|uniref:FMN-dependent NADH-azoreductase n=1 Tax=Sphingosinicella microcystinivorans TaxID=335406 RepID=UPI0022F3C25B|nr:NAD(P)H-dependent oxidoreductase [Sphingosinicella microcystinivorans]WBX85675.1 NAD(P)H-dependent oxidoreductase [Sphingosinicella microcystinivorans]
MQNILVVQSSVLGDASASRSLINDFLATVGTGANITVRDVGANPLPHLSGATLGGFSGADTSEASAERALSDELIAELQAADVIVIGAPMYNFGITSNLKSWFDRVLRAGVTFHYTAEGPVGHLAGKRVIVVETRGGFYSEGDGKALDAQEPHLKAMLNFIGITDIIFVRAERLAISPEARTDSLAAAADELKKLGAEGFALAA